MGRPIIKTNSYPWCLAAFMLIAAAMTLQAKWLTIHNDFEEYDLDGNAIQTRSGCLCKFGDTYYWYGWKGTDQNCYSSTDLLHWTKKGVIYTGSSWTNRMDVVYNDQSKQYVLILKYASGDACNLGIATCSTPDGKFQFKGDSKVFGYQIGDMSVYKDDDGKLYFLYVWNSVDGANSGGKSEHGIALFKPDYLSLSENLHVWHRGSREANMMMKHNGIYYYMTSLTDYTKSSATKYYTAPSPAGAWTDELLPMITPGNTADNSWDTQCDFVFSFKGPKDTVLMFCGDRWEKPDPMRVGDYAWLPITFSPHDSGIVNYYQDWEVDPDAGIWRPIDSKRNLALRKTATASSINGSNEANNVTDSSTWENYTSTKWTSAASDPQWIMIDLGSPMSINRVILKWDSAYAKAFKIQVATDTVTWKDVFSTAKAGLRCITDETFTATTARYVRMYGTQRGNSSKGYSLFEFMVLNDNDSASLPTMIKTKKSPAASEELLACKNNTIHYRIPSSNSVKLDVVDAHGKLIAVLVDGFKDTGDYKAVLPSILGRGIYMIRLTSGAMRLAVMQVGL
jgi:hypothetical protein